MPMRLLVMTLLCVTSLFADEDEEDSVTDQMQSSLYQTMDFSDVKITSGKTSQTLQAKKGNADISIKVDNVDQMSQLKHDWEKANPKDKKEKKRARWKSDEENDGEEKDNHSPSYEVSIKFGQK